jgi:hypothetical protein
MICFWYKCNFFEPSDFGWASVFMETAHRSKTPGAGRRCDHWRVE